MSLPQGTAAQMLQPTQMQALSGMQPLIILNPAQLATTLQPQFLLQAPSAGLVGSKNRGLPHYLNALGQYNAFLKAVKVKNCDIFMPPTLKKSV